jgi:hypothetical protein
VSRSASWCRSRSGADRAGGARAERARHAFVARAARATPRSRHDPTHPGATHIVVARFIAAQARFRCESV